ncbi:TetR/AcrR family transcriptional regulator [Muriicola sp. Z0-33]|uniref:TetR/AcrR family transcriptional regulator n=1 Tax=Muriicola sp. Z0-33 TaxID=2816957 RepID=UPI0022385882|nr:TetR/AcrR family transcriptional regulator [Muriicola sp. Z0-33]MCW5516934.1 TetR/AcrR family transcriptional regulator [Muriicola sp. Z0-33]
MKKHMKEDVIKAGEYLFKNNGYYNTSTEDILMESDYPRSSFYYHFKSKEKFAEEVLEYYGKNSVKMYSSVLKDKNIISPIERFTLFFDIMCTIAENKEFKSECLIQKLSVECAGTNENIRNAALSQLVQILAVYEACIIEGQLKKEIRDDIEANTVANLIQSQLYGGFIVSRLNNSSDVMKENMNLTIDYIRR